MKQIIPFTKDITFKTKIGELTSISLDDDLTLKGEDMIVGNFYIKGSYKMLDTQVAEEEYSYKIPCEIAISDEYDTFDCTIDIDDFYYEIINGEILRVNISLAIDHLVRKELQEEEVLVRKVTDNDLEKEKVNVLLEEDVEEEVEILDDITKDTLVEEKKEEEVIQEVNEEFRVDRDVPKEIKKEEMVMDKDIPKEIRNEEVQVSNEISRDDKSNITLDAQLNIMNSTVEETYLTYSVYLFREGDDIDSIITKYGITKDDLADYNDLSNIVAGTKLVIPSFIKND